MYRFCWLMAGDGVLGSGKQCTPQEFKNSRIARNVRFWKV